eukprot:m.122240 g.122240  ORF g.122240 m.122240 type:complete len:115 (-) comp52115_c0_seq1:444-788(-)
MTDAQLELLLEATKAGDLDQCQQLVRQCGASIITTLLKGNTALHFAAFRGRIQILQFFLAHNLDVNVKDDVIKDPLRHHSLSSSLHWRIWHSPVIGLLFCDLLGFAWSGTERHC